MREYVFRLNRIYIRSTRKKRAPRAIRYIKQKLERALKKTVKIGMDINEYIWKRGAEKPARRVVVVVEDKGEYAIARLKGEENWISINTP